MRMYIRQSNLMLEHNHRKQDVVFEGQSIGKVGEPRGEQESRSWEGEQPYQNGDIDIESGEEEDMNEDESNGTRHRIHKSSFCCETGHNRRKCPWLLQSHEWVGKHVISPTKHSARIIGWLPADRSVLTSLSHAPSCLSGLEVDFC